MEMAAQIKRGISRQFSTGSIRKSGRFSFKRQSSMDNHRHTRRFSFGRQSSLDPIRRSTVMEEQLTVPENLDSTMQLLFMACTGDAKGIEALLNEGIDVNSIDLDGRTALHIAACEGNVEVVKLLLSRKANINARDRWGSTGDLGGYLQKKGRLKPSKSLKFALDIARGINYLHECKPDPIIHCNLMPKNILLDSGGQLKVAGFGLLRLSKISADKFKLADPGAGNHNASVYTAPELYNEEIFDKSVDAFSFAVILYEMIEGVYPFHPKPAEEAIKIMCVERKRPTFKKLKNYPSELRDLIELCWSGEPSLRPSFSDIILRLDTVIAHGWKHGWWKDTFKLPWL